MTIDENPAWGLAPGAETIDHDEWVEDLVAADHPDAALALPLSLHVSAEVLPSADQVWRALAQKGSSAWVSDDEDPPC